MKIKIVKCYRIYGFESKVRKYIGWRLKIETKNEVRLFKLPFLKKELRGKNDY